MAHFLIDEVATSSTMARSWLVFGSLVWLEIVNKTLPNEIGCKLTLIEGSYFSTTTLRLGMILVSKQRKELANSFKFETKWIWHLRIMKRPPISCGTSPKARKFMFLFENSSQVISLYWHLEHLCGSCRQVSQLWFKVVESQKLCFVDCKLPKKFNNFMGRLGIFLEKAPNFWKEIITNIIHGTKHCHRYSPNTKNVEYTCDMLS